MRYKPGDDCAKKLLTNARSKALSMVGFGADVYMGMFDDVEYVNLAKIKHNEEDFILRASSKIRAATSVAEVNVITEKLESMVEVDTITSEAFDALAEVAIERIKEIG